MEGGKETLDNKIFPVICWILQLVDQSSEYRTLYSDCYFMFVKILGVTLIKKIISMLHWTLKVQEDSGPAEEILMTEAPFIIHMLMQKMFLSTKEDNGTH